MECIRPSRVPKCQYGKEIGLKTKVGVVCGIEKTVKVVALSTMKDGHQEVRNSREQELDGRRICQ